MKTTVIITLCLLTFAAFAAELPYPLGHRDPTPEEQAYIDARVKKVSWIAPEEFSIKRALAESPFEVKSSPLLIPSAVDNSLLKYCPQIYTQGGLNSCAAFHSTYYFCSYVQARDYDWDIKDRAANQHRLASPAFTYNLMNGNRNQPTPVPVHMVQLTEIGAPTWDDMYYDGSDYSTWPTESAWINALNYRMGTTYLVDCSVQAGIDAIKQRLANGDIAVTHFTVRDTFWSYPNDVDGINNKVLYWQVEGHVGGHGCTIIGYDDNRPYVDHRDGQTYQGAFLCMNSWGLGWGTYNSTDKGDRGYYWVAYRMFLESEFGPDIYFNTDRYHYGPRLYALTGINHTQRGYLVHGGGIGPTGSPAFEGPDSLKYYTDLWQGHADGTITDTDRVALDLTDSLPYLQMGASNTLFVRTAIETISIQDATVTSADFFIDLDKTGTFTTLYSSDPSYTIPHGDVRYATVELVLPASNDIYVDASNTSGPWDGSSDYPYETIADGISAATFGDEVVVRDGIYTGTGNTGLNLESKMITLISENGPSTTIIDGGGTNRAFYLNTYDSPQSVIDGFTITNCYSALYGGGIYCLTGDTIITNCIITGNSAGEKGGGFCSKEHSRSTLTNCLIYGNTAGDFGGGVFSGNGNLDVSNCTIVGNSTVNPGGTGGGIMYNWKSTGTVTNTIIWDNSADQGPQIGLGAEGAPSEVTFTFCDVEGGDSAAHVAPDSTLDWSAGNLDTDPLFVTGPLGDYYLNQITAGQASNSPCVDAGSDTAANLGMDTMSTNTIQLLDGGTVDMGYHYPVNLCIYTIEESGGNITIRWNFAAGTSYTVRWSADMQNWNDVPVGETDEWTDTNTAGYAQKYYQIEEN